MMFRFERFVLDAESGELLDSGRRVALEPQVLQLLQYLVENRGRIVSKDELNEVIWQGRVVSDAALNTRIRAVRRVLGDDHKKQQFLRTYPKRGVQFVARTECLDGEDCPRGTVPRQIGPRAVLVALLLVFGALGTLLWWQGRATSDSGLPERPSIVVLPFDDLSGDPEQAHVADAFTEDLITDLSRIRGAFVIARRTSFMYQSEALDVREVADELGVRYVLEGSVRRSDDRVRVNAQLIDAETRSHVWAERYERDLDELFSVQNNVTGQIAAALKAELREAESRRQRPVASLEAWDYALRGNVRLFNPGGAADFRDAKSLLDQAIALDPEIASAWSGLAFVHFVASLRHLPGISAEDSADASLAAAQRAVSLDPRDAEGHWMVGVGLARNGQPAQGLESCRLAMELNPNNDCAYVCAGLTNMALGNLAEARRHFQRALRLNPRFRPSTKHTYMGMVHLHGGDNARAIVALNRAIAGAPNDPMAHLALAAALALSGRPEAAGVALERATTGASGEPLSVEGLRRSHSWMGPGFERVLEGLRLAGLPER